MRRLTKRETRQLCGKLAEAVTMATDALLRNEDTVQVACEIISELHGLEPGWRDTCAGFLLNDPAKKKKKKK